MFLRTRKFKTGRYALAADVALNKRYWWAAIGSESDRLRAEQRCPKPSARKLARWHDE